MADQRTDDEVGDAACWAHLVCPECGAVTDGGSTHQCADGEEDVHPAST